MMMNLKAKHIEIYGIVQGVGYRPFIFNLAGKYALKGSVGNTGKGVLIHVEGDDDKLALFTKSICIEKPRLAYVTDVLVEDIPPEGYSDFSIAGSKGKNEIRTLVSPDMCTCDDCAAELFDKADRRFHYPFINCTNCGPRYTIIDKLPYDRPYTTMKPFVMCDRCHAEYDNPSDRRFHAQPNACPDCGPHVMLFDNKRNKIETANPVQEAIRLLKKGHILAIKGLGGFHLSVDAENDSAVQSLRKRKLREEKPLALMAFDLEAISSFAIMDEKEKALLSSFERPVVLLKKRFPEFLSSHVAPQNPYLGVMLPYTPLHFLLLENKFTALVMTSANRKDEPIVIDNENAFERLQDIADFFLIHDRDIRVRCDDSILRHVSGDTRPVRRSRGYAPLPVFLKRDVPMILSCGAELKNTICLTKDNFAFLSQHLGDLKYMSTYEFFTDTIARMQTLFDISPVCIAHDRHPDYLSTRYAMEQHGLPRFPIQHHHAHVASCMAENGADGDVIGIVCDGTGLGDDGHIWGGEILVASETRYERVAHFSYTPMPGGDTAIKEPWRMGLSYLYQVFGEDGILMDLPFLNTLDDQKKQIAGDMIRKQINTPLTSSLGRLFDGVAAIIGIRNQVSFEGQAALELEMTAPCDLEQVLAMPPYEFSWENKKKRIIHAGPFIKGVVADIKHGVDPSVISGRFHGSLILLFSRLAKEISKETGLNRVALTGGVFQNTILLSGLIRNLSKEGLTVLTHRLVPANDGGIALGQALIASSLYRNG
ncbi:MAG: carbamoyltransferase HypF [Proteobacteria bacterium]|nr:carbamoyltransferase HypF [Pseudomonadota bacterium]